MINTLHIWPLEPVEENGKINLSAMIEQNGQKPFCLWFSVPAERRDDLNKTAEAFTAAAIFHAMKTSTKLIVHGQVSPSLLRNLEEFQAVWINWLPDKYSKIEITATNESEPNYHGKPDKAIMAFSGGLDSCFTAYRHKTGNCGRQKRNITAGVMVHGFDIPLNDKDTFNSAAEKAKKIVNSIDIDLIPIATNFRDMGDNWDIVHEAGVAASLMLFEKSFKSGIIASSFSYDSFNLNIPWGSNPLTDSFLSSSRFEIINDGSMFNRTHKLELLANWPQALEYMRVCWEGKKLDTNCCKCEKCVRDILSFYALGMKPSKCFEHDITEQQIETVHVPDLAILFEYKCMLSAARQRGITEPWVKSLEKCIRQNELRLNGTGISWKKIRTKLAVRTRLRKILNSQLYGENVKVYEGAVK